MPFENTHLFLADQVKQKLQHEVMAEVLEQNLDHYYLGAVFPDTLFYSKDAQISQIAYRFHGDKGVPTNWFMLKVLDHIKGSGDWLNFAFMAGYLTHCAADMTFHPLINWLSGYQAQGNDKHKQRSSYLHWHYETLINSRLNHGFNLIQQVNPSLIDDLIAPQILDIDAVLITKALKRQILYFNMLPSRFFYYVFRILGRIGFVPPEAIAGFNTNLNTEDIVLPQIFQYRNILTGAERKTTLNKLIDDALDLGCRLIDSAYLYFTETITREECKKTITGENLSTGQLGKTKEDIRFSSLQPGTTKTQRA